MYYYSQDLEEIYEITAMEHHAIVNIFHFVFFTDS